MHSNTIILLLITEIILHLLPLLLTLLLTAAGTAAANVPLLPRRRQRAAVRGLRDDGPRRTVRSKHPPGAAAEAREEGRQWSCYHQW